MEATKYIYIKADTNDGDYITSLKEINEIDLERLIKIYVVVKSNKNKWETLYDSDNQPYIMYKKLLSSDDIEFFGNFIPYGDNGVHRIHSIEIYDVINIQTL